MSHRELFRAEQLPVLQNKMFSTAEEAIACTKGDVVLVQDMETGMVFNSVFDPELLDYSDDYQNEQACSAVFQAHLHAATTIIDRYFQGKTLIEVGCGKGYFLNHLRQSGYVVTGIDPAYEGTSPHIVKARFERGLGVSSEGVMLRHVLEHMCDPIEFLSRIASANGGKGLIYIEVPCFDWICSHRAWFDVFYMSLGTSLAGSTFMPLLILPRFTPPMLQHGMPLIFRRTSLPVLGAVFILRKHEARRVDRSRRSGVAHPRG
jgi:SAM-dependent methyltransferase